MNLVLKWEEFAFPILSLVGEVVDGPDKQSPHWAML